MRNRTEEKVYRGSRKHVLDWTGRESFRDEFRDLLGDVPADLSAAVFMPRGSRQPDEARLEAFGPKWLPDHPAWVSIRQWWLVHERGANTPNWDIAVGCEIENRPGLVLVEAKANWPELGRSGKSTPSKSSPRSIANHQRIGGAIDEAKRAWSLHSEGVSISRDSHYQLSNRLAFTWKLATLGIPTILVYLGFTGDEGISDAGQPFRDGADWQSAFDEYIQRQLPKGLFEKRFDFGKAPAWVLVRDRPVLEQSPSVPRRASR